MERLTNRNATWIDDELWESACEPDCEEIDAVYRKLKYYEDLEENGKLIKIDAQPTINAQPTSQVLNQSMKKLLDKIAKYFKNDYTGNDSTAPKLEISIQDMRAIAAIHVDWCRLKRKLRDESSLDRQDFTK